MLFRRFLARSFTEEFVELVVVAAHRARGFLDLLNGLVSHLLFGDHAVEGFLNRVEGDVCAVAQI